MAALHVRPAQPFDAGGMATFLTGIAGPEGPPGGPLTVPEMRDWTSTPGSLWHVAERGGDIAGVQWIEAHPAAPPGVASIATLIGPDGLAIGAALWRATWAAARAAGIREIRARLDPRNEGGRAFYGSRGFERVADAPDGRVAMVFCP
jgi:L-amino acid N-acyltransferase YncA